MLKQAKPTRVHILSSLSNRNDCFISSLSYFLMPSWMTLIDLCVRAVHEFFFCCVFHWYSMTHICEHFYVECVFANNTTLNAQSVRFPITTKRTNRTVELCILHCIDVVVPIAFNTVCMCQSINLWLYISKEIGTWDQQQKKNKLNYKFSKINTKQIKKIYIQRQTY